MSEANRQLALRFLDAVSNGDAAAQGACLTDDAYAVTTGFAGVSGRRDRATMLATVDAFRDIIPGGLHPIVKRTVAEGDTVVVEWEAKAELSNGVPYCNQYVFIFSFRDGLISRLHEYFCTALADRTILPLLAEKNAQLAHGSG